MIDIFGTTLNNIENLNAIDDTLNENPGHQFTWPDLKFNLQSKGLDLYSLNNMNIFNDTDIIDRTSFASKMQELNSIDISKPNIYTKISKEPSMEGRFGLAKRVGSKLNYNESDTEIADYFASIESGGDYNARNKGSSAFGKYQVIRGTLVDKAKDLGISVKEARTPEGQEMVMHSLLSDYKDRLKEFNLPVTKENMFVLHNLGQTGGVRVLRGNYTGDDIKAMRANVSSEERKLPTKELVKAYTTRYNINIPPKQES
jgi:hypothetical protein